MTGGNSQWYNWQLDGYLVTTELLEEGGSEWRTLVPNLSRGRNGARATNIGGKIFLLGGQDENKNYPEEVHIIYWSWPDTDPQIPWSSVLTSISGLEGGQSKLEPHFPDL